MTKTSSRILIVEDDDRRRVWFETRFAECERDVTDQVAVAIQWLTKRDYDLIFLDHDLIEEHYFEAMADDGLTGYVVAAWLAQNPERQAHAQIIIHSLNFPGADRMIETLQRAGREAEHVPFPYLPELFLK
jgi:CheY-like chemotaxis protein